MIHGFMPVKYPLHMDNITVAQYKSCANKIVGTWYNEFPDEVLVFSFIYDFTQQSDLLIADKNIRKEVTYNILSTPEDEWVLFIWDDHANEITFYYIELLSSDVLVLSNNKMEYKVYQRKVDNGFVHKILNAIQKQ
jgi:hypothetical protein